MRRILLLSMLFVCFAISKNLAQCSITTSAITGSPSVCANTNGVTYSVTNNAGSTYAWTITGGTPVSPSTTNSITVNWGAAGSGNVKVIETFSGGCVGNAVNLAVVINPIPITSAISGSTSGCQNVPATYYVTGTGGTTYTWTVTGGTPYITYSCGGWIASTCTTNVSGIPITNNQIYVQWTSPGTGTISVVETNPSGCVGAPVSLQVSVSTLPTVSAPAGRMCVGSTMQLSPSTGGTWSSSSPLTATVTSSGGVTAVANGSVTFTFIASSGCSKSISINVGPPLASQINSCFPATVCQNQIFTYYTGGGPCYPGTTLGSTYTWTVTGGTIVNGNGTSSAIVNWVTPGSGNLSVVETAYGGCSGPVANFPVTINAVPSSTIIGSTNICTPSSGLNYSVPFNSGDTYAWTISGGTIVSGANTNSITVNWNAGVGSVTGNVSVVETTSNGCTGTSNLNVSISNPSINQIVGNGTVCTNTSSSYYVQYYYSSGGHSGADGRSRYDWTITGGTLTSGANTPNITVSWGPAGTGSISVVETTYAGCQESPITFPVVINGPSTGSITGASNVCASSSSTYSVTNTSGSAYNWVVTGGTVGSGYGTNSITVSWGAGSSGTVSVAETNAAGCTGTAINKSVTINSNPVTSAISGNANACQNTNGLSYSVVNTPGSAYAWTVTGGTLASGNGTNSITVNWGAGSSGTISVVETNSAGCVGIAVNKYVTISTNPTTSAITGYTNICANTNGVGYSVNNTPGSSYAWSMAGGTLVSGNGTNNITVNWGTAGPGNVNVIETNAAGCIGTVVNKPVTINSYPVTSSIVGNSSVCANSIGVTYSVVNTSGSTYAWSIIGGTPQTSSTGNSINVNWGPAGTGNLSVIETNAAGCTGTAVNLPVSINAPVTSAITGTSPVCANSTGVAYSVTNRVGSTYLWTVPNGTIVSGINTNAITINWGVSSSTISVVETNSSGCKGNAVSFGVVVNANPTASTINGSITVCQSAQYNSGSYNYYVAGGTGSTYVWTITGGTPISPSTTNSIDVKWTALSSGNVKVIETNSAGCSGSPINLPVLIKTVATSPITGNTAACANTNGVSYSVINTPGSTYAWTITGGGSVASGAGTSNIIVNWTVAGAGNVKVVETSSIGCVGTAVNLPVTINALPTTSPISGNIITCTNLNGVVYSVGNTVGSTYSWTPTGGTLASGNGTSNITVNWGAVGSGNVKVVETNAAGCVGAAVNLVVTIKANPNTSAITGNAAPCPNSTGIAYSVTNTVSSIYNWSITGGTKATGGTTNAITVNWGPGGPGNVSVVETNAAGCVGTIINKPVTVSPLTSSIAGNIAVCPNSNGVAYSVANVTGNTYTWSSTGGTVVCGQNTSTILVNWGATGPGNMKVVETNPSTTCVGVPVNLPVTITSTPATSAITGNAAVCSNATGVAYSVTNSSGNTYAWTVSGGTLMSGNGTSNIIVNWNSSGTGNVSVVETSSTGCVGIAVNKMVAIGSPTTSGITGNTNLCVPSNGIAYSVTNTPGSSYVWAINGGTQVSGGTTNSITVNWSLSGSGSVRVTETNSTGCAGATVSQVVTVNPTPATSGIIGNNSVCPNATGVSYSITNTPGSTYVWTISGGGTQASGGNSNSIAVNWGATGTGNVSVVETNNFGCTGVIVNLPVTINALPTITVSPASATISYGGSVSLTASGASTYSWLPPTGLNTTTGATVTASPLTATTYTVSGTDTHGCIGTKTVLVSPTCTPPSITITASNGYNLCKVPSTTLTVTPISGASYSWTSSLGDYVGSSNSLTVYDEETYTVTVNVGGCTNSASRTIVRTGTLCNAQVRVAAGSQPAPVENDDSPKGHKISVHPNPANHEVIVETPWRAEHDTQVVLYDMMGRVSGSGILKKGEWTVTISTSEVANGMYVVRIGTGDQANSEKVIIEHK